MRARKASSAANVFVVGAIPANTGDGSRVQAYYTSGGDYIVSDKGDLKLSSVVPHEFGHFFTLAHPFFGWEGQAWTAAEYGGVPVPIRSPGGTFNEKADSSNCTVAGDRICDTPPDYLFAFSEIQSNCTEFEGDALDPDGMPVDPMENNLMSYFTSCIDYDLTPDQKDAILLDYYSSGRSYLRSGYVPAEGEITSTANLISPIGGETTEGYNEVRFTWNKVENAQFYVLEIDETPTFGFRMRDYIVTDTSVVIDDAELRANRRHFWRVRPYSECFTDTEFAIEEQFRTGRDLVNTNEISSLNGWSVQPNPVRSDNALSVQIMASEAFEGTIELVSLRGEIINSTANQRIPIGESNWPLEVSGLVNGIYFVRLHTANGTAVQRVTVLN